MGTQHPIQEVQEPHPVERIVIETFSNGTLKVSAPTDKILALGMLELAKFTLTQSKEEKSLLRPEISFPPGWDPRGKPVS